MDFPIHSKNPMFDPFSLFLVQKYMQKIRLCHAQHHIGSNTMLVPEKTKEPIPKNFCTGRTNLIHRTLVATAGGPIRK